jgi:DNA topoisomerase I
VNLVIVESPAKAKTIKKYLGKGYDVIASKGHIVDLPKSELGVDVDNNFKPKYVVTKEAALSAIKKEFKKAKNLILAVDLDREGEAIGWHIAKELKLINDKGDIISRKYGLERIVFTEITKDAIQSAIKSPREINMNLVDAQQARRVLDRIVGYKLSPLLWKKIRFGLSAGRVQSVALRLIVDREEERNAFIADEYWSIKANLSKKSLNKKVDLLVKKNEDEKIEEKDNGYYFELVKIDNKKPNITEEDQAKKIVSEIKQLDWVISSIESKITERSPKPPFTTSTLQQAASGRLGYSAKQTMRIAQKLYEAGLITYMRTDSVVMSKDALNAARDYINKNIGKDYLPEKINIYKGKSKTAQEAHEAIRPSDFKKSPDSLKLTDADFKLYRLIWNRALASQMKKAKIENSKAVIDVSKYKFQITGQRIIFDGFLKLYKDSINEVDLPKFKEGQQLFPHEFIAAQHFTQPPPRYSEATLVKALESHDIGRPSTYAPTISTIITRKYVEKEGRYLKPTDTGTVVNKLLVKHFPEIVDTSFTSEIEDQLDKVALGEKQWQELVKDFYKPFIKQLEKKDEELKREDFTVIGKSNWKCPECKKKMVVKLGRYGRFLSCSNFPDCKGMRSEDGRTEEDIAKEAKSEKFLKIYKPSPKTKDDRDFILKNGRFGQFWAHPDYPKVKDARPLEYTPKIFKKIYGTTPKTSDGKKMILRRGRFGEFWAHPDYPDKKEVIRIKKKEVDEKKRELGLIEDNEDKSK